jgi:nicotinic acid phosphoribosyltransferase
MANHQLESSDFALTVDLYQLTMANVLFELDRHEQATFELVVSPMHGERNI